MAALMQHARVDSSSQSGSNASSPSSPTASFHVQQQGQVNIPPRNSSFNRNIGAPLMPDTSYMASLDPPPGLTYGQFLSTWTDAHVARWLSDNKCAHHAETFRVSDIRGDVVLELDQGTLKEMGVTSIGDRMRIMNGLKGLRQKSMSRNILGASSSANSQSSSDAGGDGRKREDTAAAGARLRRLDSGRPAPLQLSQGAPRGDLPRLIRDGIDSARIRPLPQPTPSATTTSPNSMPVTTPSTATSERNRGVPIPPPPRSTAPMPPPTRGSGRPLNLLVGQPGYRTPTQAEVSSYASTPLPPAPGSQAYGLPHDPRPGNLGGGKIPARSNSPLSASGGGPRAHLRSPDANAAHGRNASMSSLNGSSSALSPASATSGKHPRRPSTSGQPLVLPSTLPVPINPYPINLSPIAEGFVPPQSMHAGSPATPAAYTVGRGPFMRPITPSHSNGPSLEDLRRGLVKFQLPEEGRSFTINVADCAGGIEVLEKALKKFNKLAGRNPDVMDYVQTAEGGLIVDGWGVYLDWGHENGSATPLTEADLLAICHAAPDEPAREHGLTLRRINKPKKSALQQLFGGGAHDSPTSPRLPGYRGDDDDGRPLGTGQTTSVAMKRASSISVLSGLGVPDPEKILDPPTSPTLNTPQPKATPQRQSFIKPSKLRNFFGQRPPSELITTHLPDYFPGAQRKVLERTWRNSSLHGKPSGFGGRRDSAASWATAAPNHSRFSVSTMGSHMSPNRGSMDAPPPIPTRPSFTLSLNDESEPPRVSLSTEDGRSFELDPDERPQLLPPVNLPSESLVATMESLTRNEHRPPSSLSSKRMSYITELRSKRDVSDTASLMTVDQITAEVENRRASQMLHLDGSSSDEWTKVGSDDEDTLENEKEVEEVEEVPAEEPADVEEEEEEDEDEDEDEEEEAGATKWIRGALIGAGSFGQVYLGMDASNGLLMAVKQVELPKGTTPNEERKKNMLTALEREIELLKVLQHPNIVQYLYSSMDEDHLNIFLEYVPGGSITALLSNYGAFEEPLVRNFLRQILQGLAYLHDQDIIHRDIKGANILVDNKGNIKISDFGISKKVGGALIAGSRANRPSLQGSVFWMAPEVVKQTAHSPKADIWSVGCLVVEMFTGEHPWAQLTQMQAIFKIGSSARPTVPADISAEAKEFLELTFDLDYEKRPSALESLQHPWLAIKPAKSSSKNAAAKALPAVEVAA